jgi:hypothetical protein
MSHTTRPSLDRTDIRLARHSQIVEYAEPCFELRATDLPSRREYPECVYEPDVP